MDALGAKIGRLLERDDLTAEQMHVRLVGLLLQENRRCQAQLRTLHRQLAAEQRHGLALETSRQALLALSQALWREAASHPDRAAHPLAHHAAQRQRLYDRAYQLAQLHGQAAAPAPDGTAGNSAQRPPNPLNYNPRPARG
jgi:hypothetical protein